MPTATPIEGSVTITATCAFCGERLRAITTTANGRTFGPWWHGYNGEEDCQAVLVTLSDPADAATAVL